MKAILSDYGLKEPMIVENATIVGKWSGLGEMVDWVAPARNVNPLLLLKIEQAGFRFTLNRSGNVYELTTRLMCTNFLED